MYECFPACLYVHHICVWCLKSLEEAPRAPGTSGDGGWAMMYVLGTKPTSSARAILTFDRWVPSWLFLVWHLVRLQLRTQAPWACMISGCWNALQSKGSESEVAGFDNLDSVVTRPPFQAFLSHRQSLNKVAVAVQGMRRWETGLLWRLAMM